MITYAASTDIDAIIERYQRVEFDKHSLFLRRTLPKTRRPFERFMTSNELLVSLPDVSTDEQFNETTLRQYFCKYGSIVSCRVVIAFTTFLIDFVHSSSVDRAVLDEPHFYNENELILTKYMSPRRMQNDQIPWLLARESRSRDGFVLMETIRRLNDAIEAIEFGQSVALRLTKREYERKHTKLAKKEAEGMNELQQRWAELSVNVQRMKESNRSLARSIEESARMKEERSLSYAGEIEDVRSRRGQLKDALQYLQSL